MKTLTHREMAVLSVLWVTGPQQANTILRHCEDDLFSGSISNLYKLLDRMVGYGFLRHEDRLFSARVSQEEAAQIEVSGVFEKLLASGVPPQTIQAASKVALAPVKANDGT